MSFSFVVVILASFFPSSSKNDFMNSAYLTLYMLNNNNNKILQLVKLVWRKAFRCYPNGVEEELNTYLMSVSVGCIAMKGPLWNVLVHVKTFIWI